MTNEEAVWLYDLAAVAMEVFEGGHSRRDADDKRYSICSAGTLGKAFLTILRERARIRGMSEEDVWRNCHAHLIAKGLRRPIHFWNGLREIELAADDILRSVRAIVSDASVILHPSNPSNHE